MGLAQSHDGDGDQNQEEAQQIQPGKGGIEKQHGDNHRAYGLYGGEYAAYQAAHDAAPGLEQAEGEHRTQDDDAGHEQNELAAELHALDVPRTEKQQHHHTADGHAPAGDGKHMVLLHQLSGGNGIKGEAHRTDKAPNRTLDRYGQGGEVEMCYAGKGTQHHQRYAAQLIRARLLAGGNGGPDQNNHGAAIGDDRGKGYIGVLHRAVIAVLAQSGAQQGKHQQGGPGLLVPQDLQGLISHNGGYGESDQSAYEKADGHQPVGGDTTAAEHHLTAGTAHGPEQAAQQGHAVALDQERVIGLSHKMPSFIH